MAHISDRVTECAAQARKAKTSSDDFEVHAAWSRVFDLVPASHASQVGQIHDLLFEVGELKVKARRPRRAMLAQAFDDLASAIR